MKKNTIIKIITLDPGHFHAALIHKEMYQDVDPVVYLYAPEGADVDRHLELIGQFQKRNVNPTKWNIKIYLGDDFFDKMLKEKPGKLLIISGNNAKKTKYILEAVKAGMHVLADKPMVINAKDFELLKQAYIEAKKNKVLLYDIMTERFEITSIIQKEFSEIHSVFGEMQKGSTEEPAITKESIHHFYKIVSGKPLVRPPWYFDVEQQGEGIVDVTNHLIDLVQWTCFPDLALDYKKDIELIYARRWPTILTQSEFTEVTNNSIFPSYLQKDIKTNTMLHVYANGEINYKLKGIHAKVMVKWDYKAPDGASDSHCSIMRGTTSNLVIRQGEKGNHQPNLYIEPVNIGAKKDFESLIISSLQNIWVNYPGITISKVENGWIVNIPDKYKIGHEAHFGQVTEKFLKYLDEGELPNWEILNTLARYQLTTQALEYCKGTN